MSKESESYRLDMLRRLEEKYSKPKPSEVFEAEQVIAKYRDEQETARAAIPDAYPVVPGWSRYGMLVRASRRWGGN